MKIARQLAKYVEIWNDVFMQYNVKEAGQKAEKLARPNIDTGMGLERTVAILNGAKSVYDTGCLKNVIDFIGQRIFKKNLNFNIPDRASLHGKKIIFLINSPPVYYKL